MDLLIWGGIVPGCLAAAWGIFRRPIRNFAEDLHLDRARASFRLQREGLEARFVAALERIDPIDHFRWDRARWHDEVLWARDRRSRVLLALVGVRFEVCGFEPGSEPRARHATALFEYRRGRWHAEGKRLDETRPDEAVFRNRRFEPVLVAPLPRRPS